MSAAVRSRGSERLDGRHASRGTRNAYAHDGGREMVADVAGALGLIEAQLGERMGSPRRPRSPTPIAVQGEQRTVGIVVNRSVRFRR
jgi:hypothetical protein